MDPQRLTWVRTGEPNGSGSGYLVGPQLVLTALHVVRDDGRWAGRVAVRVGHPHFGELVERHAEVCWPDPQAGIPPEDALDIALLWLDAPVAAAGEGPIRWGRPGGTARIPFTGAGLPAFAADEGSDAQFEDLHGELSVVSTSLPGWVLDCPVWPGRGETGGPGIPGQRGRRREGGRDGDPGGRRAGGQDGNPSQRSSDGRNGDPGRHDERPWAGASGSAIFCHGRIVGVAVEDNRTMDWRRLHAAPIHEALSLPGFARLVARHGHPGTTAVLEDVTGESRPVPPGGDGVAWPVEVGPVPALASAFQPRSTLRDRIESARSGSGSVVLTQVLSGGGGFGKTQLAAACATDALTQGVDLVVWASATETQQVITQYAQAAADLRLPGATRQDPEADARALLKWLATTSRRWLVVLDDITHPTELSPWWPASRTGTGWVLATTRLNDARLTGGRRTRIDIDVYSPEEADAYLRERLDGDGMGHLLDDRAADLAEALGHLPLALGLAAAHMINEDLTCTAYLRRFADRRTRLDEALPESADTEGYGRQITVALLLSLDAARAADDSGLAVHVLRLVALLDPAGHPHNLWTTPSLLDHLAASGTSPSTADQAHSALRLLHRYALIICDTHAEPRGVRVHALTARAVRENTPESDLACLVDTAADALLRIWPEVDQPHQDLAAVLRANTDALADHAQDHFWQPGAHELLFRAGHSVLDAGLATTGAAYWRRMADTAERILGADHVDTLSSHANLAVAYRYDGLTAMAIAIEERLVVESERLLGDSHPDTLIARANLAASYRQAGRTHEAIPIEQMVLTQSEQLLGHDHAQTLNARANLAASYWEVNRTDEAISIEEQVLSQSEGLLGLDHPDTLMARTNLAASYRQAGRTHEAIAIEEQVMTDCERVLGIDHPETLNARANLAASYWTVRRTAEAIAIEERLMSDCERVLGVDHPDTLSARANLAISYRQAGRTHEALRLLERALADRQRVLGPDHPNTRLASAHLASLQQDIRDEGERPTPLTDTEPS
ncbi:FxSxx-COOH system tetratricopeptide repeat protein [Streptomyces sp. NPDC056361]|uniref:FxSxx-COOH system tetratricopeptide repeat protein n=1 Tax=Streptomyces sp. NPDC056361 TaxID=3345795 RepID=UPI0035DF969C